MWREQRNVSLRVVINAVIINKLNSQGGGSGGGGEQGWENMLWLLIICNLKFAPPSSSPQVECQAGSVLWRAATGHSGARGELISSTLTASDSICGRVLCSCADSTLPPTGGEAATPQDERGNKDFQMFV